MKTSLWYFAFPSQAMIVIALLSFPTNLMFISLRFAHIAVVTATEGTKKLNYLPLPLQSQYEHYLLPWYPFFLLPLTSWLDIEPICDVNGNDVKYAIAVAVWTSL